MKHRLTQGDQSALKNRQRRSNDLHLNSSRVNENVGINNDVQGNTTKPPRIEAALDLCYLLFVCNNLPFLPPAISSTQQVILLVASNMSIATIMSNVI